MCLTLFSLAKWLKALLYEEKVFPMEVDVLIFSNKKSVMTKSGNQFAILFLRTLFKSLRIFLSSKWYKFWLKNEKAPIGNVIKKEDTLRSIKREYLVIVGGGKGVDRDTTLCTNCVSKFFSRELSVSPICQGRRGIWVSYQFSISSGV